MVDLYSYIGSNIKKREKLYRMYKELMKSQRLNDGTMPKQVLSYLKENYHFNFQPINCSPTKRRKYPNIKIDGFNIFDREYYSVKGTGESIYRKAFSHGDIKVKIKGKTLFIVAKYPEFKMPFLIPYNQSMLIYERK